MKLKIFRTAIFLLCFLPAPSLALTAEEILLLKQNGVSEKTIQMMLQSEIEVQRDRAGNDRSGVETITRPNGQSAIIYSTGNQNHDRHSAEERLKEKRAWEMLRHIIVDTRETAD